MRSHDPGNARRIIEEVEETIGWLNLFALEAGLPDEIVEELRSRLEHIEHVAARI